MKKQRKQGQAPLGKALMNNLNKKNAYTPHDDMAVFFQKSQNNEQFEKAQRMKSIIERDSLTEFLVEAQMANKDFEADRNLKMKDVREEIMNKRVKEQSEIIKDQELYEEERNRILGGLRIPRKPQWTTTDTKQQFVKKQNQAFLDWRRKLAQVQQGQMNLKLTPFEKNLEVWRQLWRVVQRAHVLVQIVDARDILFFRCQDLEAYVKEVSGGHKRNVLLINKSDLVSQQAREVWSKYLNEKGISHVFFSAKAEQKRIEEREEKQKKLDQVENSDQSEEEEDKNEVQKGMMIGELHGQDADKPNGEDKVEQNKQLPKRSQQQKTEPKKQLTFAFNTPQLASVQDIIICIKAIAQQFKLLNAKKPHQKPFELEVGMVGYPNVGKSSVINSLLNKKKVGVASQPGKTKHYQTLYLTKDIVLVDCPGLVFPNVAATIAEMVLNGVIPIDNLREIYSPMTLLVQRIPRSMIEEKYGVRFKEGIYNAETLLQGYANLKGLHTGSGLPNESQAARVVLKDYTTGHLTHCKYPPGIQPKVIEQKQQESNQPKLPVSVMNEIKKKQLEEKALDNNFFDKEAEEKQTIEDIVKGLTTEDLLDLVQGKSVNGMKLKKDQRKEIKFAMKRGEETEAIKKKYLLKKPIQQQGHKQFIRN